MSQTMLRLEAQNAQLLALMQQGVGLGCSGSTVLNTDPGDAAINVSKMPSPRRSG